MKVAILTTDNREHYRDFTNPEPSFGTAPEALFHGLAALPEIEVHVVSCLQHPVRSPEKIAANIWYHSLHVPKIGWLRTFYQGCIRATRKKLREIRPDLVHGQGTERNNALGAVFSGFPNVLTIHGNMRLVARLEQARPFSFPWLAARLEAFTIPRSEGVVCITNYTRDAVASLARRTWLLPNAVDERFFRIQPAPSGGPAIILCVGVICPRKNQNDFIRALDPLGKERPLRVVFSGAASRDDAYGREFFELLETRPWCEHAGLVNRERLGSLLQSASLLALPSLEDNCPMVVLEAMAAGVPVLAAKVGGVPDLIEDGANGVFCDPRDAASMRAGVTGLLDNPARVRELAAEAKRRANERFHPKTIAQRHLEIYREVLETRRGK